MSKHHPKNCICNTCTKLAFNDYLLRVEKHRPKPPKSGTATVLVRSYRVKAHFRKNPRHAAANPALRQLIESFVRGLMSPSQPKLKVVRGGRR